MLWTFDAEARAPRPPADSVALRIEDVTPAGDGSHVVFLTDLGNDRVVPIQIGESEAVSIAFRLAGRARGRPLTHDLLEDAVAGLGGRVVQVHVHGYVDGAFQARVTLRRKRALLHLDARASDGIALALGAELPVWMDRELYETVGVTVGDLLESLRQLRPGQPPSADEAL